MLDFMTAPNGASSPQDVARKRKIAEALMMQGMDTGPVGHWTQGLARMAQAGAGAYKDYKADSEEKAGKEGASAKIAAALKDGSLSNSDTFMQLMGDPWVSENQGKIAAALFETEQAKKNPKYEFIKGPNDSIYTANPYDPNSVKESVPGQAPMTTDQQNYSYGQKDPGFNDWYVNTKKAGATQVNNNMKYETEYDKSRGKNFADTANDFDKAERQAIGTLNSLGAMKGLLQNQNTYTGTGAGAVQELKRAAVAMGGDPAMVTSTESFNAMAKQAALDNMGGSLGSGFSNADRDFVVGQVPSIQNTPEGNMMLIGIRGKIEQRKIEIARMARQYEQQNGRIDNGFMDQLSQWAEQNPLFPQDMMQQQPMPQPGQAQQQGGQDEIEMLLRKYGQ